MPRPLRLLVLFLALASATAAALWLFPVVEPTVRAWGRDYLSFRRAERHREVLLEASRESGVDPNLLAAVMVAESSGRVGVVSTAGAMGLFQLSEVTARWRAEKLGLEPPTTEQLLSDPLLNARLGADNLAWLLDTYDGDELRALCAYNTGTRSLKRKTDEAGGWEAWRARGERLGNSEILQYGRKVLRYRDEFVRRGLFPREIAEETDGSGTEEGDGGGARVVPLERPGEGPPAAPAEPLERPVEHRAEGDEPAVDGDP